MKAKAKRMALAAGCLLVLATMGCESGSKRDTGPEATRERASVTVFPVVLAGRPNPEVAKVLAVLLERGGLERIEIAAATYVADADAASGFAEFVAKQGIDTDCALWADYRGSPGRGVAEVRGVLASADGEVIWSDRQKPGDADFDRLTPDCPMTCTVLLVSRLREPLHLADPLREDAPKGTLAQRFEREAGLPSEAERAAMEKRLARLREAAPEATVAVRPVRINDDYSRADAEALARGINAEGLLAARSEKEELRFEFTPSGNQQKVLWSGARSLREAARRRPADADYLLSAHYFLDAKGGRVFAVHLYLLDRDGELVMVDFQNSHHEDFRRIRPASAGDCTKLALVRLARRLK